MYLYLQFNSNVKIIAQFGFCRYPVENKINVWLKLEDWYVVTDKISNRLRDKKKKKKKKSIWDSGKKV